MDKSSSHFRPLKVLILAIISILYLIFLIVEFANFKNKSYLINESALHQLDSIKLINKAYIIGGGRGNPEHYEFQSQNGFSFIIEGAPYNQIINKKFVRDTLQYSGTNFTIFTDKNGFETFSNGNKSKDIEVYQFAIGNKKYIDTKAINNSGQSRILQLVIYFSVAYLLLFIYFYRLKKFD